MENILNASNLYNDIFGDGNQWVNEYVTIDSIQKDCLNMLKSDVNTIKISHFYPYDKELVEALFNVSSSYISNQVEKTIIIERFTEIDCEFIGMFDNFLKRNQIVTGIEWIRIRMNFDCCKRFNQLLINNEHIKKLKTNETNSIIFQNVSLQELTIESVYIAELPKLLLMPLIKSLKITVDVTIDYKDFGHLKYAFSNTNSLKSIKINQFYGIGRDDGGDDYDIDTSTINKFIMCFIKSKNNSVKELCIDERGFFLTDETHNKLKDYISNNKIITKFACTTKYINDCQYLCQNDSIEELSIINDTDELFIDDIMIKSIEKLILTNKTIACLHFMNLPNENHCKILMEAIKKNGTLVMHDKAQPSGTIEKIECDSDKTHDEWNNLLSEVNNIKKLKIQYTGTYLDLFAGHQIIPMINIINEYVGLN
ncbi:MAG: hypothetical protein Edafosvirus6_54 [Edafosvirus sp.]|uniref:Uncharacterized protein n=1 Tax=Edafosvirus sp. TaxID=2487765 RepID=A0A3G4ZTI2_9VIRU|nr:MAG: hypothetical protein Edafosvirus6_54 [Edafosvirus sp.]